MAWNPYDDIFNPVGIEDDYRYAPWENVERYNQPNPTPPAGPVAPAAEEEGGGGGGGGGYGQGPYTEGWVSNLLGPGGFFEQWQQGGYGYDPEWLRKSTVGAEDYWNQQRDQWYDAGTEDLATSGRLYSGGPRSAMTRDIEEAYRENLGGDINNLMIQNLESQFAGRGDWFENLMGAITGERGYGLDLQQLGLQGAGLGLQETGMYMNFLINLLGMGV